jgi:hypothetical protein
VQRPLTSGPGGGGGVAGQPHFAASHEFASWARSRGGGNMESEA